MLKWAVHSKKPQENQPCDFDDEKDTCLRQSFTDKQLRRSLDGPTIKKSKKPSRYQRRSLGSAAVRKNHLRCENKENINYIGNTPNYFKEGFVKKESLALKDVSNITPTGTPVKPLERKSLIPTKEEKPPDLSKTPPTYSRRVREAKKRKLEMSSSGNNSSTSSSFDRNSRFCKSERRIKPYSPEKISTLTHSTSEPSLNDISDRLSDTIRQSIKINKQIRSYNLSTTKATSEGLVEIEYDKDSIINCVEKPLIDKSKSTVPIFGHHIFMNNPLYFTNSELPSYVKSLKRTRKKSNEFESSFKSPTIDKKDAHTLLREACSPVAITPLSMKLADLRFSMMSDREPSERPKFSTEVTEYFPKIEIPYNIPIRDEETSTEMENKFILSKESATNETGSTVSTTQMGDVTLERMIEDIIKSTKIVKNRRKMLNKNNESVKVEVPKLEAKDLFVKPQAENKSDLIKEAKYVSLSRENSISPHNSPTKTIKISRKFNEKLIKKLPIGCVLLDDGDGYNEREVATPRPASEVLNTNRLLSRSKSFHISSMQPTNLLNVPTGSTPDLFSASKEANLRLRRQKCIRRKKSTLSNDSLRPRLIESALTLNMEIPSPATELHNVSIYENDLIFKHESKRSSMTSLKSNMSTSSMMPQPSGGNFNSKDLFAMKSDDIPSPITPLTNLKRPSTKLSDERANKTSKLDEDVISDATTPVLECKSTRRCLTYSPEEASITSSEEKRRSTASNRFERSCERYPVPKGTIDLEISTVNDVVDVHVIRCRDLHRLNGNAEDINAYAKVVISGETETESAQSHRSVFQRTSVLYGRREPEFQRHLKLPLPPVIYEHQHVLVSVWHRDKKYRRSEFLGCVSFPLKDAVTSDISGTFFLQSQVYMRTTSAHEGRCRDSVTDRANMGDSENQDEPKENHVDKGATTNGPTSNSQSVAAALQKEADEHLFLRYLELDPPEDPAVPRKTQRNGRTPFTTTRKLTRGTTGGFGFTVVWTRPPKVERVAAGGSAERAGLRAGDYIVFVGNKNVVTSGEEEVRNLVKSSGQTLNLETFRRVPQNGVGPRPRVSAAPTLQSEGTPPPQHTPRSPRGAPASPAPVARPPTACSSTSQSLDRRKLHLPQVTFSKEHLPQASGLSTDGRKRALLALISREQNYSTCLQFGIVRFVSPLAERADLISPSDHLLLFQNIEEILRLSEDIVEQVVQEDGEIQTSAVVEVYLQKTPVFLSLYKKYCLGLKRADCVLVKKSKDPSGAFSRFCTSPPIPRRRPDITSLVHKPLEQFREILRLMKAAAASNGSGPYDQLEKKQLQVIVEQLQTAYQDVTAGSGLMGLAGDGKPLLSVADLESRLVFTRCKPFVLSTPGRQWIFGGELSRVEGRTARPYWALLFSDLLLFATVSRDRVLFVTEEPVALSAVAEAQFNVRKKATEFRLILGRPGGESPLVSCSPRTPGRRVTIILRAPSIDLKAVWQSLLQRQIYRAHTMIGTPLGSPLDSPDPQLTFSLATLDSQQRQTRRSSVETQTQSVADGRSTRSKGSTLHLQRWMTQLPETEELDPLEPDLETWSIEELRKRSKELNLLEVADIVANNAKTSPSENKENEKSPSKSSNSGSQITVRTSPVVVDTIPVCRQCHKKCLSKPNSPLVSQKEPILPKKEPNQPSPQTSLSNKSSKSDCSTNCEGRIPKHFAYHLERKGAMKLRPGDPHAALKVIDSIEQSQKMLKSTSYDLKTDSPLLSRHVSRSSSNKSQLEQRNNSIRTPSPATSSRNHSPLSTSHTTCSSMVFNSSSNDLRMSNCNVNNQIQCVVAQEKYINEVKCVENITLNNNKSKNSETLTREQMTKQRAEHALNKVLSMNVIAKRETYGSCMKTSAIFLDDDSDNEKEIKFQSKMRRSPKMGISAVSKMNGDIYKKTDNIENCNGNMKNAASDHDVELMLMGLSALNPASHLVRVDPFKRPITNNTTSSRPGSLSSLKSESPVPNIAVVPPTPDFNPANKTDGVIDDSPDSPDVPEEPPYVTLKRYGTLSSLERFPSDETDDGNVRPQDTDPSKNFSQTNPSGGIMGWTARAGSFVVEKMNIFSYSESPPNTSVLQKQPSFLERCLGVSDWKPVFGGEEGAGEGGEGSGASGEEAWGTPSSGDLSDNLADSEHGTLSSPTKSSSSYAGDDDTELMMDELLMAPTITGPTLRPLLPRRRLEPLLEEECSDSESENNKPTPTNPEQQGSVGGLSADVYCNAPRQSPSACVRGAEGYRAAAAQLKPTQEFVCGPAVDQNVSPDRTPTNEAPSTLLQSVSRDYADVRAGVAAAAGAVAAGAAGRRGSASSASTPSTLDRTTIHNPSTPQHDPVPTVSVPASAELRSDQQKKPVTPPEERLSPRAEMRLALDQGKDMLADQEVSWAGGSDPWSFRAACQQSLLRRVASADAVIHVAPATPPRSRPAHRTAPHTTSRSSVYAWKAPESEKPMEMEQLAQAEVQMMRSRTPSQCQNGKILGFLRRRASSDSPRREPLLLNARPFSPRRTTEKQFEKRFWKQVTKRRQSFGAVSQI